MCFLKSLTRGVVCNSLETEKPVARGFPFKLGLKDRFLWRGKPEYVDENKNKIMNTKLTEDQECPN